MVVHTCGYIKINSPLVVSKEVFQIIGNWVLEDSNGRIQRAIELSPNFEPILDENALVLSGKIFFERSFTVRSLVRRRGRIQQIEKPDFYHEEIEFFIDLTTRYGVVSPYKYYNVALEVLTAAIPQQTDLHSQVSPVLFKLGSLSRDFPRQWKGLASKTGGKVRTLVLYGDDIQEDEEFGEGYRKAIKNSIGIYTSYFTNGRGEEKILVGRRGNIVFYNRKQYDKILGFLKDVLMPYVENPVRIE